MGLETFAAEVSRIGLEAMKLPVPNPNWREVALRPLPPSWIQQHPSIANHSYISIHHIQQLLDEAFNCQWQWICGYVEFCEGRPVLPPRRYRNQQNGHQLEEQPPFVRVMGALIVPGLGARTGWGVKVISFSDKSREQANAVKAAESDALKAAARRFGFAMELRVGDTDEWPWPGLQAADEATTGEEVEPAYHAAAVQPASWDDVPQEVERLIRYKRFMGITHNDELNPLVASWSNGQIQTHTGLTPATLKSFNDWLEQYWGALPEESPEGATVHAG